MKYFLIDQAKDDVLMALARAELSKRGKQFRSMLTSFVDLHLKATIFKQINFSEQNQQYCAGLPKDMHAYVNAQNPKMILDSGGSLYNLCDYHESST